LCVESGDLDSLPNSSRRLGISMSETKPFVIANLRQSQGGRVVARFDLHYAGLKLIDLQLAYDRNKARFDLIHPKKGQYSQALGEHVSDRDQLGGSGRSPKPSY